MPRTPASIRLTEEEKNILVEWSKGATESRPVERARIILLSNEGHTVEEIARRLQTQPARIFKWRQRFAKHRLCGLSDLPRSGLPRKYDEVTEKRVLDLLAQPPLEGHARWNGGLLAQVLGDVSQAQVWRILRRRAVQLTRRHTWRVRISAESEPKVIDIVGLYLNPPQNGLVLCAGEARHMRPLKTAEGHLRLTSGKAAANFKRPENRQSAMTLSEALGIMTARLLAGHAQRRGRRQFLEFMSDVVDTWPDHEIHVVLSHPSTNQPKWDRWLRTQSRVRLHFNPADLSWMTQIECWFSILAGGLRGGTGFTQPRRLREAIEAFCGAHHNGVAPFEWVKIPASSRTADGRPVVL